MVPSRIGTITSLSTISWSVTALLSAFCRSLPFATSAAKVAEIKRLDATSESTGWEASRRGVVHRNGQQPDGFLSRLRGAAREVGRLHSCSFRVEASSISDRVVAGLRGRRVMVTPSGDRASATALTTAAGAPMAPPSPTPL